MSLLSTQYSALSTFIQRLALLFPPCNAQIAQRRPSPSQSRHAAASAALPVWQLCHFGDISRASRPPLQRENDRELPDVLFLNANRFLWQVF
jgi:hypothetical protein